MTRDSKLERALGKMSKTGAQQRVVLRKHVGQQSMIDRSDKFMT